MRRLLILPAVLLVLLGAPVLALEETTPPPATTEEIPVAPNKLMFISALDEQHRLGSLRSRLPPDVGHSLSHPNYLEVSPSGVDKGTALVALLDQLSVGHEEVVAFGDGHNDLPMFGVVGRSVAMPHAPSPVLLAADLVATSGLSAAIRSLPWIR